MSKEVVGQLIAEQFDFKWEIPNFLSLEGESYDSPLYFFGDTIWFLRVYPNGEISPKEHIALYVVREDLGRPVVVKFSVFLKTTSGKRTIVSEIQKNFEEKGKLKSKWGVAKALPRSQLIDHESLFLPSGALTVICTLKFHEKRWFRADEMLQKYLQARSQRTEAFTQTEADNDCQSEQLAAATPDKKFVRDYKELLLSGDGCDVTLLVKGQKFNAHRAILRARSPVFASMLSHNMIEKNTGLIDIADCDPEHFNDFLLFLYCGSVDCITSQNMCSLYKASDKYDVQDLKSECLAFIKSHLDVDNFCDVIALALQLNEADLVKQATDFFAKNMLRIIVTVKWQVFLNENTTQGNELIIKGLAAKERPNP